MNQTIQSILNRRSVRHYVDQPIDEAVLNEIVRIATYAPSAHGKEPYKIVVVCNPETLVELDRLNAAVLGSSSHPFYGAPAVCVVFGDSSVDTCVEDGSLVIGYMMLAAQSLGVSSCWIHRAREVFQTNAGTALLKKWGIPDGYIGIGHCALGYTDAPVTNVKIPKADHVIYD